MRIGGVAVVTVLGLAGCGQDPILERVEAEKASASASTPVSAPAPAPGSAEAPPRVEAGEPGPVQAEAPPTGDPSVPPPGGSVGDPSVPPPGGAPGVPGAPGAGNGPSVTLTGVVTYAEWKSGAVQLTAFDGDHAAGAGGHPKVIGFGTIDRPGPFTVSVPAGAGKVYVEASVDEDGDGRPGPQDPQGKADRFPVTVGDEGVDGLEIRLIKREPPPGSGRE